MEIRSKFKAIREKCGVSQLQLAELSGLSNGMICRYERGQNDITMENLIRLLSCLRSSPAELFADDIHTIPVLEIDDITIPVGEITRQGDYENCYAIVNRKQGIFPQDSISIINPHSTAVAGDVIAWIDDDGRINFDHYRDLSGQIYVGVVLETEWNYRR